MPVERLSLLRDLFVSVLLGEEADQSIRDLFHF